MRDAEKLVQTDPAVLGKVRGIRIGDKRDAERREAKRMSRYLWERRRKWRDSMNRLEHSRSRIEEARRRTRIAIRDYEALQRMAGDKQALKKVMVRKIQARARALSRVTGKAIRESKLSDERKQQLDLAHRRAQERRRHRERQRERGKAYGLDLDLF